ncbi:unnamed protein product [Urochloa humidicola]
MHLGDFLGVNDQVARGEKDRWQYSGSRQPHYDPPEGITYDGSGDSQIRQQYVSSGQQSSLIYFDSSVLSEQQAQLTTSVFPVDNPTSVIEPLSNPQNNGQLHIVKDIGEQQQLTDQSDNGICAQLYEDKDQDHNGVSCEDKGSSCCAENPNDWNEDLMDIKLRKDGLGVR